METINKITLSGIIALLTMYSKRGNYWQNSPKGRLMYSSGCLKTDIMI